MAASAVLLSATNIVGGFTITKRMLDMFKRKTDPAEYNYMYSIPTLGSVGCLLAAHFAAIPSVYTMGYLASSLCCIGGISGLAS